MTRTLSLLIYYAYLPAFVFFFFFNDTATTEIYTLSLHDALPISPGRARSRCGQARSLAHADRARSHRPVPRVEEDRKSTRLNSSSPDHLVCRLLLEKKKKRITKKMWFAAQRHLLAVFRRMRSHSG